MLCPHMVAQLLIAGSPSSSALATLETIAAFAANAFRRHLDWLDLILAQTLLLKARSPAMTTRTRNSSSRRLPTSSENKKHYGVS